MLLIVSQLDLHTVGRLVETQQLRRSQDRDRMPLQVGPEDDPHSLVGQVEVVGMGYDVAEHRQIQIEALTGPKDPQGSQLVHLPAGEEVWKDTEPIQGRQRRPRQDAGSRLSRRLLRIDHCHLCTRLRESQRSRESDDVPANHHHVCHVNASAASRARPRNARPFEARIGRTCSRSIAPLEAAASTKAAAPSSWPGTKG
jgi:hypothetical protein